LKKADDGAGFAIHFEKLFEKTCHSENLTVKFAAEFYEGAVEVGFLVTPPPCTRVSSNPFMTGIQKIRHNQVGVEQLNLFDCFPSIFSLSAYVKVSLAGEEFAKRPTNEGVVIND
jgi:hypothetical protein